MHTEASERMKTSVASNWLCCVVLAGFVCSCGSSFRFPAEVVRLVLPRTGSEIVGEVQLPARRTFAPVPLVVLVDDGPPIDIDPRRTQANQIQQLQATLVSNGYAVWRPLRDAWPSDSLVVRCPDKLTSQVLLGFLSARNIRGIDTARVVFLGFGQGGVIAALAAERSAGRVHALGLVNTPARSVDRTLLSGTFRDSVNLRRLEQFFDDIWTDKYNDSDFVMNGRVECWRSWVVLSGEMTDRVARLSVPTLAVQGTADSLLPLLDIERFRRAIGRRQLSQVHTAVGLRHDLRDEIPDPGQDKKAISPRFVSIVLEWLKLVAPPAG